MWTIMRTKTIRHWALGLPALAAAWAATGAAHAAPHNGGINFQTPMTDVAHNVQDFHNFVMVIITAITIFVTALLLWVMLRYNRKANPKPKTFSHNTTVEVLWTVLPVLILVAIAFKSFPLLYEQDVMPDVAESEIVDVKIYGRQWFWSYIYGEGDNTVEFDSNMIPDDMVNPAKGQIRQLSVDNPFVAPAG
jgi:cytochrome c oxidase subunit 2